MLEGGSKTALFNVTAASRSALLSTGSVQSKLRCPVSGKYVQDFEDLEEKIYKTVN